MGWYSQYWFAITLKDKSRAQNIINAIRYSCLGGCTNSLKDNVLTVGVEFKYGGIRDMEQIAQVFIDESYEITQVLGYIDMGSWPEPDEDIDSVYIYDMETKKFKNTHVNKNIDFNMPNGRDITPTKDTDEYDVEFIDDFEDDAGPVEAKKKAPVKIKAKEPPKDEESEEEEPKPKSKPKCKGVKSEEIKSKDEESEDEPAEPVKEKAKDEDCPKDESKENPKQTSSGVVVVSNGQKVTIYPKQKERIVIVMNKYSVRIETTTL